jgi:hypothetical protein
MLADSIGPSLLLEMKSAEAEGKGAFSAGLCCAWIEIDEKDTSVAMKHNWIAARKVHIREFIAHQPFFGV